MKKMIRASKKIVQASKADRQYYVVHYGWDEGGPESGPIFKSDNIIVKARSEKDAENRVANKLGNGIEGCWAEPATEEDIKAFEEDMRQSQEEYDRLVEIGLIDPELDAEMMETYGGPQFDKMSIRELKEYYEDFVEGDAEESWRFEDMGITTFRDWVKYLKENGYR